MMMDGLSVDCGFLNGRYSVRHVAGLLRESGALTPHQFTNDNTLLLLREPWATHTHTHTRTRTLLKSHHFSGILPWGRLWQSGSAALKSLRGVHPNTMGCF